MTPNTTAQDANRVFDEFSIKKLILQIRNTCAYLISKWKKILIFAFICGLAGIVYSFFKKPNYVAEITFALDEGAEQGSKNGVSDLAEQLGFGPSLEAGGVFSSITNIVELMQSRLLIEKTLRDSVAVDGRSLVFADFFLDSLNYRDKWLKKNPYYHINFRTPKINPRDILNENNILSNIYEVITKKNIKIDQKGKGTTIVSVTCVSEHELFSKYFLEAWLREVTQFYIQTKTQRSKNLVAFIQKRTDSVKNAYYTALYGRAAFTDALINPIRQTASVSSEKQQTDIQILRASYTELVRSLESAKTSLMRETPLIQYIDVPILPLKKLTSNMIRNFLILFFVGAILSAGYFFVRKFWDHLVRT